MKSVEMSGQVEQLVTALDSLTVKVQGKRQDLVGGNNALLPVVSNLDMSAADVGLVDKNAAASALCNIEENPEVVEDEVSVVMEALEKKLWLLPSREEEEGEEMAVTDGKSAGRPAAEAWLKD